MSFSLVGPPFLATKFFLSPHVPFLNESHHYWKLVNVWVWLESWICTGWLMALVWTLGCRKLARLEMWYVTSLPPMFLYSLSVGVMIMLSCSANHLCVCHHCISGITGLFVCAIISISVPARRTHSHFTPPAPVATLSTVALLSLSLACCSRAILSPSFSTLSAVLSCPWYLICVLIIWISPIFGKNVLELENGYFWFWSLQSITVCDSSKAARYCVSTLLECHDLSPFPKSNVTHVLYTEWCSKPHPYPPCHTHIHCVWTIPGLLSCQSVSLRSTIEHRRFQGRELTRALMVTAEGSGKRRVAPIHTPRKARKIFQFFSHHGHLHELS